MAEEMQTRIWMYCDLPIPAHEIGNLKHWKLIGDDPVALLDEALPFIGWGSCPAGLKERIQKLVDTLGSDRSGSVTDGAEGR